MNGYDDIVTIKCYIAVRVFFIVLLIHLFFIFVIWTVFINFQSVLPFHHIGNYDESNLYSV